MKHLNFVSALQRALESPQPTWTGRLWRSRSCHCAFPQNLNYCTKCRGARSDQLCRMLIRSELIRPTCVALRVFFLWQKKNTKCFCNTTICTVIPSLVLWSGETPLLVGISPCLYQMWSVARRRSPAVNRWDIDGALHGPGGNAALSEHDGAGEIRNPPLPSNEADWEAARHRCVCWKYHHFLFRTFILLCWNTGTFITHNAT